jgi:hypothetical protein
MNLCEEVEQLCALPKKLEDKEKVAELREHYSACKSCRRRVRFRLMAGKMIEKVFHGTRSGPCDDLEALDEKVDVKDQGGTRHSRKRARRR